MGSDKNPRSCDNPPVLAAPLELRKTRKMPLPRFHRLDPDKQGQILDAAAAEFGTHGYAAASMNRIIETAGLSKGAMYYYFDGKADLWGTLVEAVFEEVGLLDQVFAGVESVEAFWQAFRQMYETGITIAEQSPRLSNVMRALALTSPTDEAMIMFSSATGMQGFRESVGRVLVVGRQLGAIRDDLSEDQLLELVLALNTVTDRWVALASYEGQDASVSALLDTIVDLNVRLLEARDSA